MAKKLIRTGAISAIQKSVEKDKTEKFRGFKRSQGKRKRERGISVLYTYIPHYFCVFASRP